MARSHAGIGRTFLALAAAVGLGGCLKAHDDVVVKADGAGTYTETLEMDMTAMKEFREAMRGMALGRPGGPGRGGPGMAEPGMDEPGMDGGDKPVAPAPTAPPAEDPLGRLKTRWKDISGLEVTKATSEEKDGKVTVRVEASFTTLEAYAKATGIETGAELFKDSEGFYMLKFERRINPAMRAMGAGAVPPGMGADAPPEGAPGGMDGAPAGGMDGAEPPKGADAPPSPMAGVIEKSLAGLDIVRTLKLPGAIVETNGTKSEDGMTVTWKVTVETLKDPRNEAQFVKFKGDGLDLKPFKVERSGRGMGGPRRGPPGGGDDK